MGGGEEGRRGGGEDGRRGGGEEGRRGGGEEGRRGRRMGGGMEGVEEAGVCMPVSNCTRTHL